MKLIEAIDAFPTLRGMRVGVDSDTVRSWFFDDVAFIQAAATHGSGAHLCALFIVSCAGFFPKGFALSNLFERIDTQHQSAALAVFAECLAKGGLQ